MNEIGKYDSSDFIHIINELLGLLFLRICVMILASLLMLVHIFPLIALFPFSLHLISK